MWIHVNPCDWSTTYARLLLGYNDASWYKFWSNHAFTWQQQSYMHKMIDQRSGWLANRVLEVDHGSSSFDEFAAEKVTKIEPFGCCENNERNEKPNYKSWVVTCNVSSVVIHSPLNHSTTSFNSLKSFHHHHQPDVYLSSSRVWPITLPLNHWWTQEEYLDLSFLARELSVTEWITCSDVATE